MTRKNKKEFVSPVDWYIASILMRFEWYDEDKNNLNRRCKAWENSILIKANSPSEAYGKAIEHGKLDEEAGEMWERDNEDRKGRWRFEGLTSLLAIYDEPEDGAEIIWNEYKNRSVKKIKSWVLPKEQLEVFDREE
jgi:hypothetical protein